MNPTDREFKEAPSRSSIEWTPALLRAARSSADGGHLSLAADFCEAVMADDRVAAAISTRCRGLLSLPISFEPARGGTKRLVKALEAGEDWWAAYPEADLSLLSAWGVLLGVGLAEQVWDEHGDRLVPKLKIWNPRALRWDWTLRAWFLRVDGGSEIEITPGDGKWILYTPYGTNRPWTHGAWRAIGLWFLLKAYAITDWARFSERHGLGTTVITTPEGTTKELRKELASDLFGVGSETVVSLPAGCDVKMVEATADTWQTFESQKNAADLGTAVSLLGQNMSTEVTGPVGTGATLHGRVLQILIDSDAETLSTCLHDQSLRHWANVNFGSPELAPWPKWDTTPPANRKEQVEVAKELASLGAATINEVRTAAGLEPLKEGGDELARPPTTNLPAQPRSFQTRAGRTLSADSAFVAGQLYTDAVADNARDRAAEIFDEDIAAVVAAVSDGESYEDVRTRLLAAYEDMNPKRLAGLTSRAIVMGEMAGRHALNEELKQEK